MHVYIFTLDEENLRLNTKLFSFTFSKEKKGEEIVIYNILCIYYSSHQKVNTYYACILW